MLSSALLSSSMQIQDIVSMSTWDTYYCTCHNRLKNFEWTISTMSIRHDVILFFRACTMMIAY